MSANTNRKFYILSLSFIARLQQHKYFEESKRPRRKRTATTPDRQEFTRQRHVITFRSTKHNTWNSWMTNVFFLQLTHSSRGNESSSYFLVQIQSVQTHRKSEKRGIIDDWTTKWPGKAGFICDSPSLVAPPLHLPSPSSSQVLPRTHTHIIKIHTGQEINRLTDKYLTWLCRVSSGWSCVPWRCWRL